MRVAWWRVCGESSRVCIKSMMLQAAGRLPDAERDDQGMEYWAGLCALACVQLCAAVASGGRALHTLL